VKRIVQVLVKSVAKENKCSTLAEEFDDDDDEFDFLDLPL